MNEAFTPPLPRPTTRAADGLPRWRWTVEEIERIAAAGFFRGAERFELLGGEIVPMSPKGRRHEIIRGKIALRLARSTPEGIFVVSEPQFNLSEDTYLEPDILVHPAAIQTPDVRGTDALLVVEVADSSLRYDLNVKAASYAAHGVREYWVINAATLLTRVHLAPAGNAYATVLEVPAEERLVPSLVPAFAIALRELDLD
jgi:Uma2 family endonuclease